MSDILANRRGFLKGVLAGAGALAWGGGGRLLAQDPGVPPAAGREYRGPNLIVVRFGGGVRRRETIDPEHTWSPFLCHDLAKRGTLFPTMEIVSAPGIQTSHGEGTLNILTGKYDKYEDVAGKFLGAQFEAKVPTLPEYLRKEFDIPEHRTLIVNSEDRTDEEFYTFSNHHRFGVEYRANVLSLYRYKTHLLRHRIEGFTGPEDELAKLKQELKKKEKVDYRREERNGQPAPVEEYWERWRTHYGESGLVNPRGDRVLTAMAIRAIQELRPRFMMINYTDCDYVHWGNVTHYLRGISIMDEGLRELVAAVDADAEYRENTVFVVVPDCGRDDNRFCDVPCQHHFGSKSSHEIFALLVGPGIARGQVVDRAVEQADVAPTIGRLMGLKTEYADGSVLSEALA